MISDLIRRYVAAPIGKVVSLLPFEPVMALGFAIAGLTALQDQLNTGADLETALTSTIILIGSKIVREMVWPAAKVTTEGVAIEPLEDPITGVED